MNKIIAILVLILTVSCAIEPQKINYGEDACHFCSMTIVDRQHAAEIVTTKGRAYKFDATECMINHIATIDTNTIGLYLVANYNNPGDLLNAKEATFIISENIPSPMGAFLSAVPTKEEAANLQKSKDGQLFNWNKLLVHLNKK